MINILFAIFLFGVLCAICAKGIYRAIKYKQSLSVKEYALLTALVIGIMIALYTGCGDIMNKKPIKFLTYQKSTILITQK